jgi:hypothetical protein
MPRTLGQKAVGAGLLAAAIAWGVAFAFRVLLFKNLVLAAVLTTMFPGDLVFVAFVGLAVGAIRYWLGNRVDRGLRFPIPANRPTPPPLPHWPAETPLVSPPPPPIFQRSVLPPRKQKHDTMLLMVIMGCLAMVGLTVILLLIWASQGDQPKSPKGGRPPARSQKRVSQVPAAGFTAVAGTLGS